MRRHFKIGAVPSVSLRALKGMNNAKTLDVWSDLIVREAMLAILFTSFGLFFLAGISILVSALLLGVPWPPVAAAWPSYGLWYMAPQLAQIILGLAAEGALSLIVVRVGLGLVVGYTLLDGYALSSLIGWLVKYYMQTLTPASLSTEFSATAHWFLVFLVGAMFVADLHLLSRYLIANSRIVNVFKYRAREKGWNQEAIDEGLKEL